MGADFHETDFGSSAWIITLLFKDASQEEIMLLIKAVVAFCLKKGINISKGRPKGEAKAITIPGEFYKEILAEFKEEVKGEEQVKRTAQSKLP